MDLGSNDARWNTTYSKNVRLDLAEIQGQADGNLVLMADSGEIHLRTDAVSRLSVNSTGNVGTSGDTSATGLYVAGTVAITDDVNIGGDLTIDGDVNNGNV
jgi:predicted acyltransferase (DUF342 family)